MSSGRRVININNLERAVSTDINRAQAFQGRDDAEIYRHMLSGQSYGELGQFPVMPTGAELPRSFEIMGGLLVRPQTGTFEIQIDPGVLYALIPDSGADDSDYKYVRDVGVGTGILAIGANASGSIRIDVIECSINSVPLTVTDSRDIYDTITNLFTPAVVTKESANRLSYRIRQGTPGAGYPTPSPGWMPLAIASVPSGAVSNNDITFWDVRPLIEDRVRTARKGSGLIPTVDELDVRGNRASAVSMIINGWWRATLRGRGIGGQFRRATPGTDVASIDIGSGDGNQSGAITEALTGHVFLYACTPFALPRWALYAPHPAVRVPRSPLGMLMASYTRPDLFGVPSATLPLPTSTGLGGVVNTEDAVCVAIVPRDTTSWPKMSGTNRNVDIRSSVGASITSAAIAGILYQFAIADTDWPPNAKAIIAEFVWNTEIAAATILAIDALIRVYADNTTTTLVSEHSTPTFQMTNNTGAPVAFTSRSGRIRIPVPVMYPSATVSPRRLDLAIIAGVGATPLTTASLIIRGYEL